MSTLSTGNHLTQSNVLRRPSPSSGLLRTDVTQGSLISGKVSTDTLSISVSVTLLHHLVTVLSTLLLRTSFGSRLSRRSLAWLARPFIRVVTNGSSWVRRTLEEFLVTDN